MRSPVPVLHVITALPPSGAERVVLELARGLPRHGFRVDVATVMGLGALEEPLRAAGAAVGCLGRQAGSPGLGAVVRGAARVRRGGYAAVHTHLFAGDTWGRAAAWIGGAPAIVSTAHNTDHDEDSSIHRLAGAALARVTDRIAAVSGAVRDHLADRGVPRSRIVVVPNGIDPAPYLGPRLPPLPVPGSPRLVALGRLVPQKGIETVLAAFARVRAQAPGATLAVAGDGPLRASLEARAAGLGLGSGAVRFLGHVDDVPALLARADLLVHAARWEGFGLAIVEAALAGVPAVATRVGGVPEVAEDGVTARLVPEGDAAALAAAALAWIGDPGALRAAGVAARGRALRLHTAERMVADYAALYGDLAGGPRR